MSITLSHEYGHHFTFHYFTLKGEDEEIEKDAYFKTRYESGLGIRYSDEVSEDENDYYDNHMWYLVESRRKTTLSYGLTNHQKNNQIL